MKKLLFAAAIAALALVACQKAEVQYVPDTNSPIRFTIENLYNMTTKANAIEVVGQEVGIWAGNPIAKVNQKYTVAAGNTLTGPTMYWDATQLESTTFTAMYPYDDEKSATEFEYDIYGADYGYVKTSDFLIASATVAPKNDVSFIFQHPFSKIEVTLDVSELTNDTVKSVGFLGVSVKGNIDITTGTVSNLASVAASEIDFVKEGDKYAAIVMPQTANPTIIVNTYAGRKYLYKLAQAVTFKAGTIATATVKVVAGVDDAQGGNASERLVTLGAFDVTEWASESAGVASKETEGNTEVTEWWYILGTVNGTCWNKLYALKATNDNTMSLTFNYTPDSKINDGDLGFKLVKVAIADASDFISDVSTWATYVKAEAGAGDVKLYVENDDNSFSHLDGSSNITFEEAGSYKIDFYTDNKNAKIVKN